MKKKVSKKSKRRLMIFGVMSIFSIGYFLITFFSYSYNFVSLKKEEKKLNSQLISLQNQKSNLKNEIQKLNNPEYVIRFAKEKYLYSGDGEYVLRIDNDNNSIVKDDTNYLCYYIIIISIVLIIILILRHRKRKKKR